MHCRPHIFQAMYIGVGRKPLASSCSRPLVQSTRRDLPNDPVSVEGRQSENLNLLKHLDMNLMAAEPWLLRQLASAL